jgi:hypothetical protein
MRECVRTATLSATGHFRRYGAALCDGGEGQINRQLRTCATKALSLWLPVTHHTLAPSRRALSP